MIGAWPGALIRGRGFQLFLTSFLGLYAELLCIRWMPAHVRFLSYFTNFILLASFLGLGVGILSARRKLPLEAGRHQLRLVTQAGETRSRTVEIAPNHETTLTVVFSEP